MKVLFVLTYYDPHVSGLTIYVKRLATELVQRGHEITVLTSRYDRRCLPRRSSTASVWCARRWRFASARA